MHFPVEYILSLIFEMTSLNYSTEQKWQNVGDAPRIIAQSGITFCLSKCIDT